VLLNVPAARVEWIIWVLIYGGLLGASLGFALGRNGAAFGWALVAVGGVAAIAGAILIWVRSRMSDPTQG
jgi:hypothetical protein